jgi:hypothetical protein
MTLLQSILDQLELVEVGLCYLLLVSRLLFVLQRKLRSFSTTRICDKITANPVLTGVPSLPEPRSPPADNGGGNRGGADDEGSTTEGGGASPPAQPVSEWRPDYVSTWTVNAPRGNQIPRVPAARIFSQGATYLDHLLDDDEARSQYDWHPYHRNGQKLVAVDENGSARGLLDITAIGTLSDPSLLEPKGNFEPQNWYTGLCLEPDSVKHLVNVLRLGTISSNVKYPLHLKAKTTDVVKQHREDWPGWELEECNAFPFLFDGRTLDPEDPFARTSTVDNFTDGAVVGVAFQVTTYQMADGKRGVSFWLRGLWRLEESREAKSLAGLFTPPKKRGNTTASGSEGSPSKKRKITN